MAIEIKLRGKYRIAGASKNTGKGKGGGSAGSKAVSNHSAGLLPVGIRKHPRRRYVS